MLTIDVKKTIVKIAHGHKQTLKVVEHRLNCGSRERKKQHQQRQQHSCKDSLLKRMANGAVKLLPQEEE